MVCPLTRPYLTHLNSLHRPDTLCLLFIRQQKKDALLVCTDVCVCGCVYTFKGVTVLEKHGNMFSLFILKPVSEKPLKNRDMHD